jgi:peptide/nickel transport system permease protein
MIFYILKRILYAIPILFGVNLITFALFFMVNTPQDMAKTMLGDRYISPQAVEQWVHARGYDKPLFFNESAPGIEKVTDTLFYDQSKLLFTFSFGISDSGHDIQSDIRERMWPSFAIALPALLFGLATNIVIAVLLTFFRGTYLDTYGMSLCVLLMSISGLFYIIAGQYFIAKLFLWVPISGYASGWIAIKFVFLPVLVSIIAGLGAGGRWYRTLLLEEVNKDYVRTAKAKGLSDVTILFKHVLKNAMIPILTGVVVLIPSLFLGSLLLESFFAVPGLGSYTIDAIASQDFAIVRSMVFLGSVLYILGLILTDISYTVVDPRIRLQ